MIERLWLPIEEYDRSDPWHCRVVELAHDFGGAVRGSWGLEEEDDDNCWFAWHDEAGDRLWFEPSKWRPIPDGEV